MLADLNTAFIVAAYVVAINIVGFLLFGWDKRLAVQQSWRIPESNLLFIALVGGTLGSIAAQHLFKHKTRKQPFKLYLYGIAGMQIFLLFMLLFPESRHYLDLFIS